MHVCMAGHMAVSLSPEQLGRFYRHSICYWVNVSAPALEIGVFQIDPKQSDDFLKRF
jgi:hypothetical protein